MTLQQTSRRWSACAGFLLLVTAGLAAVVAPARYIRYADAEPILSELAVTGALPPELGTLTKPQREAAWPGWIERHDKEIRARLEQGDDAAREDEQAEQEACEARRDAAAQCGGLVHPAGSGRASAAEKRGDAVCSLDAERPDGA